MPTPLLVRPRLFSRYGLYEALVIGLYASLCALFWSNASAWTVLASERDSFVVVVIGLAAWGAALIYAFWMAMKDISKGLIKGIVGIILVLAIGVIGIFAGNARGWFSPQVFREALAAVIGGYITLAVLIRALNLLGGRSLSFDGTWLTVTAAFIPLKRIQVHEERIVDCWYQLRAAGFGTRLRDWGQASFGCDRKGGVFYEASIGRGWDRDELKRFVQEVDRLLPKG